MKGFFSGINEFFSAIPFILKKGLWWTYLVPVLLTILIFLVGWVSVDYLLSELKNLLLNQLDKNSFIYPYVVPILSGLLWLIVKIVFLFIFNYLNGYILLIIISPLLAYMSEKTEKILTGREYPFSLNKYVSDVVRGILIGIRNFFYQTILTAVILIFIFIPILGEVVAILLPFVIFFIGAYFYGFSFIDYVSERRGYKIKDSVKFVRMNAGFSIALGVIFSVMLMIPFIGSFLAGMAAETATVAASKYFNSGKGKNI
jgi:CysZ protein